MNKVVIGLSGGVDSAVAARLLLDSGTDLTAVYLDAGLPGGDKAARENARTLGIPLETVDIRHELEKLVIAPFVKGYLLGETPNPCVICNPEVKFEALCKLADHLGAFYIATGHYARVCRENGYARLLKGEPENDQSYMLCMVKRRQLDRLLLPLGDLVKTHVRTLARRECLPASDTPDSMEICFVPDGDYAAFIDERVKSPPPGNFVDGTGRVLGRHLGIHRYTVGQRRGLGISSGARLYVSEIRPGKDEIVLSGGETLKSGFISVRPINWLVYPAEDTFKACVRIRHSKAEYPALIKPSASKDEAMISFETPVRAPVRGQAAAIYRGAELVAGGVIV